MKRYVISLLLCAFLTVLLIMPVSAKKASTTLSANKETTMQLDGTGAEEKIKFIASEPVINEVPYPDIEGLTYKTYTRTVGLEINGQNVFSKSYTQEYSAVKAEVIVTDVNTKDKLKDLFFAVYDELWVGTYQKLIHVTYNHGTVSVDPMLNELQKIKSPKIKKEYDVSHRGYMVNPIESITGLSKDLTALGDGTVKWNVCVFNKEANYFHGTIVLKLKSGKLKASNYPSGNIYQAGVSGRLKKSLTVYKKAGKSKKLMIVPRRKVVNFKAFKFVNKKLYVQVTYQKKTGWVSEKGLKSLSADGTLHA